LWNLCKGKPVNMFGVIQYSILLLQNTGKSNPQKLCCKID
jgi:hypothetical protein